MSSRSSYFFLIMILNALVIGGLFLWHSGFWMEGRNNVPNLTAIVLLVFSQGGMLLSRLKQGKK
jgi:hypothetical protein